FQAEDGIRDKLVTGVQTCALPIYDLAALGHVTHQQLGILEVDLRRVGTRERAGLATAEKRTACSSISHDSYSSTAASASSRGRQIGRASCRERVEMSGVAA